MRALVPSVPPRDRPLLTPPTVRLPRLALAEGAPAHMARELLATFRDELDTQRLPALSLPPQ